VDPVAAYTDVLVYLLGQFAQGFGKLMDTPRQVGVVLQQVLVCL
jgi:hypothetical protein